MAIEPGQSLLHYLVVDKLGEGGMGEVWKATDTTLDRTVALKLLPSTFAADAERLGRFEREAKSLAALNHPHIAGIYGLHQHDDDRFIAMEYVEGEDLAERLKRGPLPVEEAVSIATAVADALSVAHANGVVHRDLKPANIVLTTDGAPKVLDFGLAKAVAPDGTLSGSQPASAEQSPTITSFGTVAGVILGTAAYMSPEQARGRPVDRRADLWALGGVLYEMLTGRVPFEGETISDTLASVLKTDPDWDLLPPDTPLAVRRVVKRCLTKDPKRRTHDAADARIELEQAFDEDELPDPLPAVSAGSPLSRATRIAWGLLAVIAAVMLGFALRGSGTTSVMRQGKVISALPTPDGVRLDLAEMSLAMSPDGEQIAFVGVDEQARSHLYVRSLDSSDARRIEGTEAATTPFWSHDGRELGFHSKSRLMRVRAEGGTPQEITQADGRYGTWRADGTILFGTGDRGPLMQVDADGGEPALVPGTDLGSGVESMTPQFLPDGRHFIFYAEDLAGDKSGIYLGELGSAEVTRLIEGLGNGAYSDGQLLYARDDILLAQPLDVDAARLTGEPQTLAGPIVHLNYPFHGFFAASSTDDRLVFLEGSQAAGLAEMVWVDRSGKELERPGIRGDLYNPRLSSDGRRLVIDVSTQETHGDIWIFDLARGSSRRLTRDPIDESHPNWSKDGSAILFFRLPDLYRVNVVGSAAAEPIHTSPNQKILTDVSPDGRYALFEELIDGQFDLRVLDLETGEAREWLGSEFSEEGARFSPDGNWVAYKTLETGRYEINIDRFPERGERFRVSTQGGGWPVWKRDGTELYFVSAAGDLMAVAIDMGSDRNPIGKPTKLFSPQLRRSYFDVSPDGERFLLVERIDPEVSSITLIQNWAEDPGSR